ELAIEAATLGFADVAHRDGRRPPERCEDPLAQRRIAGNVRGARGALDGQLQAGFPPSRE
ncbi:MAG TPA: hypothetical protein VF348_10100, partial [Usitatibacter sp.]